MWKTKKKIESTRCLCHFLTKEKQTTFLIILHFVSLWRNTLTSLRNKPVARYHHFSPPLYGHKEPGRLQPPENRPKALHCEELCRAHFYKGKALEDLSSTRTPLHSHSLFNHRLPSRARLLIHSKNIFLIILFIYLFYNPLANIVVFSTRE